MRTTALFTAAGVLLGSTAFDDASAQQKKRGRAEARSATPIACTATGCAPIEPGCRIETGFTQDGMLSGYDAVICPVRPPVPNG